MVAAPALMRAPGALISRAGSPPGRVRSQVVQRPPCAGSISRRDSRFSSASTVTPPISCSWQRTADPSAISMRAVYHRAGRASTRTGGTECAGRSPGRRAAVDEVTPRDLRRASLSGTRLTSITVAEALEHILSHFGPLEAEPTPLEDALGRVLAADVRADLDIPPFANSAMDGYAVRAADTA